MDWNEVPLEPRHLEVPLGTCKMISEPMVHLVQTVHLSWIKISTISKRIKMRFHLSLITLEYIGCSQNDYWAYGTFGANRAPQTDWNELPPEPRHLGVASGASKMISNPMVHLSKPCTYLAWTLTPSSNGPKQDLTRPTSPRGSIACVQNDFRAYGMFSTMRQD
jgi:hypothetical protein